MMTYKAVFFGAIGTIADTSDMQRRAFNDAFAHAGLDWNWTPEMYRPMLATVGGVARISQFAARAGIDVDVAALHAEKSRIYQHMLRREGVALRPGVAALIAHTRDTGGTLAWVTTTARANIDAIIDASGDALSADMFDLITDRAMVSAAKPDPEVYYTALTHLGLSETDVLVIEDTPESAWAAHSAGLSVVAFKGAAPPDTPWPETRVQTNDLADLLAR